MKKHITPSWESLTTKQFQEFAEHRNNTALNEIDLQAYGVSVIYGLPIEEVDSMDRVEYVKLLKGLLFLNNDIPQYSPAKTVTVNGRRYRFIYDVRQIKAGRYIEVKTFATEAEIISNMHKTVASIITPQRRTWYGCWKDAKYNTEQWSQYVADMQAAPFLMVYSSMVFFCHVYAVWMRNSVTYLIQQMTAKGIPTAEATAEIASLCGFMDGLITQLKLPDLKASRWTRYMS